MAEKKSYSEKLKDPRWQKKRLEILSRDHWRCRHCGDGTVTLHVHHLKYFNGRNPWDYDDNYLITLCEECHKTDHDSRSESEAVLLEALRNGGFSVSDIINLAAVADCNGPDDAVRNLVGKASLVCGMRPQDCNELADYAFKMFMRRLDESLKVKEDA